MTSRTLFLTFTLSAVQLLLPGGAASSGESSLKPTGESLQDNHNLSCPELESRLAALEPLTYSDTPEFYSDPIQGTAVWVGTLWSPAWAYLGYSGLRGQYRQGRMADARAEIEQLRQLKARRHCYER